MSRNLAVQHQRGVTVLPRRSSVILSDLEKLRASGMIFDFIPTDDMEEVESIKKQKQYFLLVNEAIAYIRDQRVDEKEKQAFLDMLSHDMMDMEQIGRAHV